MPRKTIRDTLLVLSLGYMAIGLAIALGLIPLGAPMMFVVFAFISLTSLTIGVSGIVLGRVFTYLTKVLVRSVFKGRPPLVLEVLHWIAVRLLVFLFSIPLAPFGALYSVNLISSARYGFTQFMAIAIIIMVAEISAIVLFVKLLYRDWPLNYLS
jgi:hypothetical protein